MFSNRPQVIAPKPPAPKPAPRPILSAANVLHLFTALFLFFLVMDYSGARPYPQYFTVVYLAVLAGVSASNLLRRSRWFM